MSVYKNGIDYNVAYQVQGQSCPPKPNTLENFTKNGQDFALICDSTWIPYMGIQNGFITIGKSDTVGGSNQEIWNLFKSIWLEFDTVPPQFADWPRIAAAEQIFIKNTAQWTSTTDDTMTPKTFTNAKIVTYFDESEDALGMMTTNTISNINNFIGISWVPNGYAGLGGDIGDGHPDVYVVAATDIISDPNYGDRIYDRGIPNKVYVNSEFYSAVSNNQTWIDYWDSISTVYNLDETEWLDNYFAITQNGQTLPWNTTSITNFGGKYVRLKNNDTVVGEIPYWADADIVTPIECNITDSPVTRTGTVTYQGTTKNYSITLGPVEVTLRARLYINTDNGTFDRFSIWPWGGNFDLDNDDLYKVIDNIKRIRYKPANSNQWTNFTPLTAQYLKDVRTNTGFNSTAETYCIDTITTDGYYDFEYVLILGYSDSYEPGWYGPQFYNFKYSSADPGIYAWHYDDARDSQTPWLISVDMHHDISEFAIQHQDVGFNVHLFHLVYEVDNNTQTASFDDFIRTPAAFVGFNHGWYLRDVVFNNYVAGDDGNCVYVENPDFSGYGTVWYNCPTRQHYYYGGGSFANVEPMTHTLYLHPDIYALTNHGFNDEVEGWTYQALDDFTNAGGVLLELPSNWKSQVPNYIGD